MQTQLPRRLGPIDAMFLYLEQGNQPMNVGAVCVFEGRIVYRELIRHVQSRLHLLPRYRQRILPAPLNIGHPTWEDDPEFSLRRQIHRHKLDAPGGDAQLKDLAGRIFAGTLDRDKPLWELHLVHGLAGKRSALVFKVHHCMVDGVSGLGLARVLFDLSPTPYLLDPEPFHPRPLPEAATRLYDALWDNVSDHIAHWTKLQQRLLTYGTGWSAEEIRDAVQKFASIMGNFLLPLKKLPFNRTLDEERRIAWQTFSFGEASAIHARRGCTINDVALTIITGALRRYFLRHPGKTKRVPRTVRILVPVNMREEQEGAALGNRISFLPIEAPVQIAEPLERLQAIHRTMSGMKEGRVASAVGLLLETLQGLPPLTQALGLGTVASPSVQCVLRHFTAIPPANLICTNVPGPQFPLYLLGKRLEALYPTLPVCLEMGVNFAITSYDQQMFITVSGDGQAGGEVELLSAYLQESYLELRDAAAVKEAGHGKVHRAAGRHVAQAPPNGNGHRNGHHKPRERSVARASRL